MKALWSTLRELLALMPPGARRFFVGYVVVTSSLTLLDVAALGLLAVVITPAVTGAQLRIPIFGTFPPESAPVFVLVACGLILTKSASSIALHWFATKRFATYELEVGRRLFAAYIRSSWEERSRRSTAEITRIADGGIANAMAGFILPLSLLPSAAMTFILVLGVLLLNDPLTSVIALVYLGLVALLVNRIVIRRVLSAGKINRDYGYRVAIIMTEMVDALKEISLRNKLDEVSGVVFRNRIHAVAARRRGSFLSIIPGFTFEAALVGGFLLIGAAAYLTSGLAGAVSAIALFAATGFRLIPAVNAIQASVVQATASLPGAQDVVGDLKSAEGDADRQAEGRDSADFPASPTIVRLDRVGFTYPRTTTRVLDDVSIDIPLGSSLGIVGPSGAGKSTLVDLLLGLSTPTAGSITIDSTPITTVLSAWRDRVGYVPQRVALFDGTIAQNVALTWEDDFDRERVLVALERAHLLPLIASRPEGIDARIGERGVSLSGGQQQRLGIARALYADPLVLVLDEATSALDTKTEDQVSRAIRSLQGDVTLISVAHRLSTIKDYDQICYLQEGRVAGYGTFAEVARTVPAFGEQVALAGLGAAAGLVVVETDLPRDEQ